MGRHLSFSCSPSLGFETLRISKIVVKLVSFDIWSGKICLGVLGCSPAIPHGFFCSIISWHVSHVHVKQCRVKWKASVGCKSVVVVLALQHISCACTSFDHCVVFCYSAHQRTAVLTPAKLKLQSVTNFILKMRQWHTFRNIMILIITVVMIIDHHYRHPCHQCIVVSYHNHSASLSTSSSSSPLAMLCDELAAGWFTLRVIYFDTRATLPIRPSANFSRPLQNYFILPSINSPELGTHQIFLESNNKSEQKHCKGDK